jgi:hypothetical protein
VLVGTKCNSLLLLDAASGAHRAVALPPKPAVRLGPELLYNPDGHCGMHAMDVSPDGRYIVTGGRAAEDAVVLRREGLAPVQTFAVRRPGARGAVADRAGRRAAPARSWQCAAAAWASSTPPPLTAPHLPPPGPRRLGVWPRLGDGRPLCLL